MNYYKRHIGDYARKAGHLTPLEHGVYTLILDAYYDREQAPTMAEALRYARARTPDEVKAVETVLVEFFDFRDGVYVQNRVEEEFLRVAEQANRNQTNGKKGGRPRKIRKKREETQPVSSGLPNESETKGNPLIQESTTSSSSVAIATEVSELDSDPLPQAVKTDRNICPIQRIVDLYHECLPDLPRCEKVTDARAGYLRQRWRQDLPDLGDWRNFFGYVGQSRFLTGKAPGRNGQPPFVADLEWLTKPANYAKIAEGKYHR